MSVNRGSIGELIGVHVSSIVKWGYQDNLKPAFFTKRFCEHKKHQNVNANDLRKIDALVL